MKKYNKGFTLIELLVVISIIGVLSSIVLFAVAGAKIKAQNSRRIQKVVQLRNAIELYKLNNRGYAYYSTLNNGFECALQKSGTQCIFAPASIQELTVSTAFSDALSNYIKSADGPDEKIEVQQGGTPGYLQGIVYRCLESLPDATTPNSCLRYRIWWGMKNSQSCDLGKRYTILGSGPNSVCAYDSNNDYLGF